MAKYLYLGNYSFDIEPLSSEELRELRAELEAAIETIENRVTELYAKENNRASE